MTTELKPAEWREALAQAWDLGAQWAQDDAGTFTTWLADAPNPYRLRPGERP